jgi:CspA family cold shock protein
MMTQMLTGTVRGFDARRGWGFIVSDAGDRDVFLHVSKMVDPVTPLKGMRVTFVMGTAKDGRPCAINVRRVK